MFKSILTYPEIDSTNLEAARLIRAGKISVPTIIRAEQQTAGRGSRGRSWFSGQGNLSVSYVFPITSSWGNLQLAVYPMALGLFRTLSYFLKDTPHVISVKWPNDVLINEKKISGTLHEIESFGVSRFFICGVGINVKNAPPQTSSPFPPAMLSEFTSEGLCLDKLALTLGENLLDAVNEWNVNGFDAILKTLNPHFYHLGQEITVRPHTHNSMPLHGIFDGISSKGALQLRIDQKIREIYTADIFPTLPKV